jgi:transketolase
MALAEKLLAAEFNRQDFPIIDHRTDVFAGDGCLMEGISHEAAIYAAWDARSRGRRLQSDWEALFARYAERFPEAAAEFRPHRRRAAGLRATVERALAAAQE